MISHTKLGAKKYNYIFVNFILLKDISETVSGIPIYEFLNRYYY